MGPTSISKLIFLVTTIITVQYVQSADIKGVEEGPCKKISKSAVVDSDWLKSVDKWYYLHMSRYDLYLTSGDILRNNGKDLNEVSEDKFYYESCITVTINSGDEDGEVLYEVSGFGGQTVIHRGIPSDKEPGAQDISINGEFVGVAHTTMTDNKTFIFLHMCTKDNVMVWGALSPFKSLPEETVQLIRGHATSLGFKREHFTALKFDSCPCDKNKQTKEEL